MNNQNAIDFIEGRIAHHEKWLSLLKQDFGKKDFNYIEYTQIDMRIYELKEILNILNILKNE